MSIVDLPEPLPDRTRVRVFAATIAVGLLALLARLWYLQIAHGSELQEASRINQRRLIRRVPPRGQIEDRAGRILATNRRQIVVSVVPEEIERNPNTLPLLASLLNRPLQELEETIRREKVTPFDSVRLAVDVDVATATRIEEQRLNLPGVLIGPEPIRHYPDGPLFGHLLGQMGEIPPDELRARRPEGYRPGDYCGKLGLERAYDPYLRGTNGGRLIEVDARGRMRRELNSTEPLPGATLTLTLDKELQKVAYQELQAQAAKGRPGAAVALDPNTGAVLALASVPSYDPNLFVNGITRANWKKIQDNPLLPQINRAINSAYAPGSTFKVITAAAGLETGLTGPYDRAYCRGVMFVGRWPKRCHRRRGHGSVNLNEALARSCDIFFYQLGQRLGPERMAKYARLFGLGTRTGIDLLRPGDPQIERDGIVPDPAWKAARHRGPWYGGETVDYAIGQAMLACTPLQMCNVAAAIANGGTLYRPQLVQRIVQHDAQNRPQVVRQLQPEIMGRLGLSDRTLEIIRQGMRSVMTPGGTAAHMAIPGVAVAGKTGTAEVVRNGRKVDNAWFIAYAPADRPRIAVCVFVETGGHGGTTAAPIARKIIAKHLKVQIDDVAGGASDD